MPQLTQPETKSKGLEATVIQALGPQWDVLCGTERLRCVLKKTTRDLHGNPVVGDRVLIDPPSGGMSRIVGVLPRVSMLRRPDVHRTQSAQVIVANVDQLIIVASIAFPPLNPGLIDRYLVAAWKEGIDPVICLTKCDLPIDDEVEANIATFSALEIPVLRTSVITGEGMSTLLECMEGRASVLAGLSGVGKTSLARVLLHDATLQVGAISEATGRGRHTTTSARLLPLPEGRPGFLIDLPGQRVFGLTDIRPEDLLRGFPDLARLGPCELPLCRHEDETGCVLQEALEQGTITRRRLEAYFRIHESLQEQLKASWR